MVKICIRCVVWHYVSMRESKNVLSSKTSSVFCQIDTTRQHQSLASSNFFWNYKLSHDYFAKASPGGRWLEPPDKKHSCHSHYKFSLMNICRSSLTCCSSGRGFGWRHSLALHSLVVADQMRTLNVGYD
jgi:hypothetical protein